VSLDILLHMKSDMSDELVKSMIDAERAALLKLVRKDLSSISKETADKFEAGISKYSELALPVIPKKPKKKSFRKVSAYLAFCKNLREENRKADGSLSCSVLDITKRAGDSWKKMTDSQKSTWSAKASQYTDEAKKNFKEESDEVSVESINKMDKRGIKKVAAEKSIVLPVNFSTAELKTYVASKL